MMDHVPRQRPQDRNEFGVAIICALQVEATAVKALFEEEWDAARYGKSVTDTNTYSVGSISGHRVVVVHMPGMGKVAAATAAANLIASFQNLRLVLLVGICGGAPLVPGQTSVEELLLGDVIVSTGVVQYDLGRRFPGKFARKDTPHDNLSRLSFAAGSLLTKVQTAQGCESLQRNVCQHLDVLQNQLGEKFAFPGRVEDRLFRADYVHKHHKPSECEICAVQFSSVCDEAVEATCKRLRCGQQGSDLVTRLRPEESSQPVVHFGLFASGDTVMRSGEDRDVISNRDQVIGFEMEGAGMWEMLRASACLIIKSVCDYADSHKNKRWQAYAAATAAATAKALLQHWDIYMPKPQQQPPLSRAVARVEKPSLSAEDLSLLNRLETLSYRSAKDRNPHRIEGTCEWFVGHKLFQDWQQGRSRALWVSADPGCGKSVLARHLVDNILPTTDTRTTCYFFFKDDFADQKSVTNAISCMLHQLLTQKPELFSGKMRAQLVAKGGQNFTPSFDDMWGALLMAAEDEYGGEIVCVLDALDECESRGRSQLANRLLDLHHSKKAPNLKFLLTSRPYGSIRREFHLANAAGLALVHLTGEDDAEMKQISREIDLFIRARVQAIGARWMLSQDEQDLLLHSLLRVTHRTYLWVHLTLDLIENDENIDKGKIEQLTSQIPASVDEAYNKILSTSRNPEEAKRLLHIIVAATRPLSVLEMKVALNLRESHRSYGDLDLLPDKRFQERIRDICGLFVMVVDSNIYLLHQTAREFLIKIDLETHPSKEFSRHLSWRHTVELSEAHRMLAQICLWLLQFPELHQDLPGSNDKLWDRVGDYDFLAYAALEWTYHLRMAHVKATEQMTRLVLSTINAIQQRVPFWFKAACMPAFWDTASEPGRFHPPATLLILASHLGLTQVVTTLLKEDDDSLDFRDGQGRTALSYAAQGGYYDVAEILIDGRGWGFRGLAWPPFWNGKGADLETRDRDGRTPLIWVIMAGGDDTERTMTLFLQKGANIEARDEQRYTALLWAARLGRTALVELLVARGANIEAKNSLEETPLLLASRRQDESTLEVLLQKGANPDARDAAGCTALVIAARHRTEAAAEVLIEFGALIEAKDGSGCTALSLACFEGRVDIVRLLLEKGADINSRDEAGLTPLSWACRARQEKVVKLLVENHADVESRCQAGFTPLHYAWAWGFVHCTPEQAAAAAKCLLDHGADIEAKDPDGKSLLSQYAEAGKELAVRWLLENGANIESRDTNGRTPLSLAANSYSGDLIVPILLQAGANANSIDKLGRSPLIWAAINHWTTSPPIFTHLLSHGANVEHKDARGRTALSYAVAIRNKLRVDIVELLLERGAGINTRDKRGHGPLWWAETKNETDAVVKELLIRYGAESDPENEGEGEDEHEDEDEDDDEDGETALPDASSEKGSVLDWIDTLGVD